MTIYILSCETIENKGGIYAFEWTENGSLKQTGYFPCDRPMYAVKSEKGLCVLLRQPFEKDKNSGYFFIDETLQNATEIRDTQGIVACHLCVDNNNVYIVNYLSGNIVKNGELIVQREGKGVHPIRQTQSHTHFVDKMPDGYLAVCDLGTDTLAFYDMDLNFISKANVPNGYGIRHLIFSKDEKYIYAINELIPAISVFSYAQGRAELVQTIKIPCERENANGAAIRISDGGKYLYVSCREENKIFVYDVENSSLTLLQSTDCAGNSPRDFNIYGNMLVCTNEKSENVIVFSLKNGKIDKRTQEIHLKSPLCVVV